MPIAVNPSTGETVYLTPNGTWEKAQTAVNPQTKEMLAFDGEGWKPVEAKSKGILGYIDDAVRSAASGLTFGYADELAAKMDEVTGRGGSYEQNVAKERARDEQIPGVIAILGQVAGAVGSTIAAAPVAALAGATRVGQAVGQLPNVLKFAGLGAAEGALAGSGEAVEGERLGGAAMGAAIGAPIGAAAPAIVRGVSRAANAVRGAVSPQANVAADLSRALVRDNDTPVALAQRANDLATERAGVATLADAGGENVKGLVERVAQTPGAGRTQVVPALTARQKGQAERLSFDLRELTGTNKTAKQAIDETISERAAAAKPLYDEAIAFDIAKDEGAVGTFLEAIQTGWGKSIINSSGLRRTLQTEYGINGTPGPEVLMAVIDAWKKEADDLIGASVRSGNKNKARVVGQMRDRVIAAVDEANPKYAEARNAWSGPSQYLDAIERGRGILSSKESAEEFAARFRSLSDAEKEAERIGAVSSIVGKMGGDSAKLGDMTKYLRSPEVRAKIAAIMPTPESAEAWTRRLDFEVGSSELTNRSLGNSSTARRLAEKEDAENLASDLVMDVVFQAPQSLVRRMITAGPKWLRDTMRSKADALLADVLTNPSGAANLQNVLQRAATTGRPASGMTNAAATAGAVELVNQ
jgi:DNA-directed RNA polymerase subunit F